MHSYVKNIANDLVIKTEQNTLQYTIVAYLFSNVLVRNSCLDLWMVYIGGKYEYFVFWLELYLSQCHHRLLEWNTCCDVTVVAESSNKTFRNALSDIGAEAIIKETRPTGLKSIGNKVAVLWATKTALY